MLNFNPAEELSSVSHASGLGCHCAQTSASRAWAVHVGRMAPVHVAAAVAMGPGSSASGVGPALCPDDLHPRGAHKAWPHDQQNPCEEVELASFQQEASALPTEAPEKMEPSPTFRRLQLSFQRPQLNLQHPLSH